MAAAFLVAGESICPYGRAFRGVREHGVVVRIRRTSASQFIIFHVIGYNSGSFGNSVIATATTFTSGVLPGSKNLV